MKRRSNFPKKILIVTLVLGLLLTAGIVYQSLCVPDGDGTSAVSCISPQLSLLKNVSQEEKQLTEHMIDAPFIDQTEYYPTGCESVSTVMALQYLGIDIDVNDFIDNYLDLGQAPFYTNNNIIGDSPYECFLGSPYNRSGWGCYSTVVERALNKFIDKEIYSIKRYDGTSLERLCKYYINNDIPIILWATIEMHEAYKTSTWITSQGKRCTWIAPEHCLLLVGYDSNFYYFNDPLKGKNVGYKKSDVKAAYESLGQQAVVIYKNEYNA